MSAQLTHRGTQATMTRPAASAGAGLFRSACHQIRLTVAEMNYAARRAAELQAPWSVDQKWQTR
jgi:hypothetical protein